MLICNPLKDTTPPTAATPNVPNSGPAPVEEPALETVTVPVASTPVVTRLSNWSRMLRTGCGAKFWPAVTIDCGWVVIARWVAGAWVMVTLSEVTWAKPP